MPLKKIFRNSLGTLLKNPGLFVLKFLRQKFKLTPWLRCWESWDTPLKNSGVVKKIQILKGFLEFSEFSNGPLTID